MNIDLANKVLDQISHNPKSHYQGTWVSPASHATNAPLAESNTCGTQACIAGWAVELSGSTIVTNVHFETSGYGWFGTTIDGLKTGDFFRKDWAEHGDEYLDMMRESGAYEEDLQWYETDHETGHSSSWTMIGARVLGITLDQADALFSGAQTDEDAREALSRLIDEAVKEEKRKAEEGELGE